jgi:2-polyprenyl-3-methyl-5-hydroxy-6-metoxy-1,4-benzoquinol methylase
MAVHPISQLQAVPTPERLFQAVNSFQITAAVKAAVDLDLFTAIHQGVATPADLANKLGSDARRVRILCDFLAVEGLLEKDDGRYSLPPDTQTFLTRTSPAYLGDTLQFMLHPEHMRQFTDLTAIVRDGIRPDSSAVAPDNPLWVDFATHMAPLMFMPAEAIAQQLRADSHEPWKVLDIAAGHGLFGITLARHNPNAHIVAVDWPSVLQVARKNAQKAGVAQHYSEIPGSAFEVSLGAGYDIVLLTNFLHHFDTATNVQLLKRIHSSLKPGGRVVTLEFVPEEDRVSPPTAAKFAMVMLASTPSGDAYPYSAFQRMFRDAGFSGTELVRLHGPESLVIARE